MSVITSVIQSGKIRLQSRFRILVGVSVRAIALLLLSVPVGVDLAASEVLGGAVSVDRQVSPWYLGIGAGLSQLAPEPADATLGSTSTRGTYAGFLLGRHLGGPFAAEAHLHLPGRGQIGSADVDYTVVDLAVRYRLVEGNSAGGRQTEVFALAGFGSIDRSVNAEVELENDTRFHFSAGLGAEVFVGSAVSLRVQALYLDADVQIGNVSLVWHWGSVRQRRGVVGTREKHIGPDLPSTASTALSGAATADLDRDGVIDGDDLCADSAVGFPVRDNGCALFDGVLPGIMFAAGSSTMLEPSYEQLDALISKLKAHPTATVALLAYTDDQGAIREQAILTRARLKAIAIYLSRNGIAANRLILKSMGGSQPLHDNTTAIGRERNNRVEIREHVS